MEHIIRTLDDAFDSEDKNPRHAIDAYELAIKDILACYCESNSEEISSLYINASKRLTILKERMYLEQYDVLTKEEEKEKEKPLALGGTLPPPQQQQATEIAFVVPPPTALPSIPTPAAPVVQAPIQSSAASTNDAVPGFTQFRPIEFIPPPQQQQQQQQPLLSQKPPTYSNFMKSFMASRREVAANKKIVPAPSVIMKNDNGSMGLSNNGQNNCFMNAVIQSLWNLSAFSYSFMSITSHKCTGDHRCVFCALQIIFSSLRYSSETVNPLELRCALSALSEEFKVGQMADASEAFTTVLNELHNALSQDRTGHDCCIVHNVFSIDLLDLVVCSKCGYCGDPGYSRSWAYLVPVQCVVEAHRRSPKKSFGAILGEHKNGDCTKCKECGSLTGTLKTDFDPFYPLVFTVYPVWETASSKGVVTSFIEAIPQKLDMGEFTRGRPVAYELRGMIVYYGRHYFAYFNKLRCKGSDVREWKMFDDAVVKTVGKWDKLTKVLVSGRIKPTLLFYVKV